MDAWLKWLIAAACCVVVAFGGVYAVSAFNRKMEADAFAAKRAACATDLDQFYANRVNSDLAAKIDNCVVLGYLAKDEVDAKLNPNFD